MGKDVLLRTGAERHLADEAVSPVPAPLTRENTGTGSLQSLGSPSLARKGGWGGLRRTGRDRWAC